MNFKVVFYTVVFLCLSFALLAQKDGSISYYQSKEALKEKLDSLNNLPIAKSQDSVLSLINEASEHFPKDLDASHLIIEAYSIDEMLNIRSNKIARMVTDSILILLKERGEVRVLSRKDSYLHQNTGQAIYVDLMISREVHKEGRLFVELKNFRRKYPCEFVVKNRVSYQELNPMEFRYVLRTIYILNEDNISLSKNGEILGWRAEKHYVVYDRHTKSYYRSFSKIKKLFQACRK